MALCISALFNRSYCPGVVVLYKWTRLGGTLTLSMSAFCNIILFWCSRALYTLV